MENENGRLSFSVGLNIEDLRRNAEASKKLLSDIATGAEQQGAIIDTAFGTAGAAKSFSILTNAIAGAGTEIRDLDFGTAEEKIGALSFIIKQNESVIADETELLQRWQEEAQQAFKEGDTETLAKITADMSMQADKIRELNTETQGYKDALSAVMEVAGMAGGQVEAPRLFKSEEEIQHLEELKAKIVETQTEIARVGAEGGDTAPLTASLSAMKEELNECDRAAVEAAASLGSDLGGRAAEAQEQLSALNAAISSQQEIIDRLTKALEDARDRQEELQHTEGATSDEVEKAAATYDTLSESLSKAKAQLAVLQSKQREAGAKWREVSAEVKAHDSVMVKMLGGYDNYKKMSDALPGPLKGVIGSLQGMTGAAKAFIATPLGAIIAAIVLALQALKTWFNSSAEGQMKFAEISGYVSGVLGQLKEIVIKIGKALFSAFSDPKKAIQDLWKLLKENLINRLVAVADIGKAVGKILKSAFTLDFDGVKEGYKDMINGNLKLLTGIDDVIGKTKKLTQAVGDAAKETADIAKEQEKLDMEMSKWESKNQQIEQAKAKARGRMYNTTLSPKERKKAEAEYKKLLDDQIKMELKFIDKKIDLQKRRMAITTNTIEDEKDLNKYLAEREAILTKKEQELATLQRSSGRIASAGTTEANDKKREEEQRKKDLQKLGEMEGSLILANEDRKLSLMKEGHAKRMAELDTQAARERRKVEVLRQKFINLNKSAGVKTGEDGLTEVQRTELQKANDLIRENHTQGVKRLFEDELKQVLTYNQKRQKIEEDFEEKRKNLYKEDGKTLKDGVTVGNIAELNYQKDEALKAVDEQFAQRSETYKAWCGWISRLSLDELEKVLTQAQKELADLQKNGGSEQDIAVASAKVNRASDAVNKARAGISVSPGVTTIKEWQDLYKTLNDCTNGFKEMGQQVGGLVGELISAAGEISSSTLSMISSIAQLTHESTEATKNTATAGAAAIKSVERASLVLAIIGAALQIMNKITALSQKFKLEKEKALKERAEVLQWEINHADLMILNRQGVDVVEEMNKALNKTIAALSEGKKLTSENIDNLILSGKVTKDTADKLISSLTKASAAMEKAFGMQKYIDEGQKFQKQVEQAVTAMQRAEAHKPKSFFEKAWDWIRGGKQEKEAEEMKRKAAEQYGEALKTLDNLAATIVGDTSENIAKSLSDAFFTAFKNGEDYAAAWGSKVDDIVGEMMKRMVVDNLLQGNMKRIFNEYRKRWYSDKGDFLGYQKVQESMGEFASRLKAEGQNFADMVEHLPDELKTLFKGTAERQASSKGIATASQDSVDELNGRATAIQSHTFSISENTKTLLNTANSILKSVLNIERNTATTTEQVRQISKGVQGVRDSVEDIKVKGIKIK